MSNRNYDLLKRGCGNRTLSANEQIQLQFITTSNTRNEVLDILRTGEIADRAVTAHGFGDATSTLN